MIRASVCAAVVIAAVFSACSLLLSKHRFALEQRLVTSTSVTSRIDCSRVLTLCCRGVSTVVSKYMHNFDSGVTTPRLRHNSLSPGSTVWNHSVAEIVRHNAIEEGGTLTMRNVCSLILPGLLALILASSAPF